jgi:hypothetical protein
MIADIPLGQVGIPFLVEHHLMIPGMIDLKRRACLVGAMQAVF